MIRVHRLKGEPFFINADLVESIEATPDTVLRLIDGRRAMVAETPEEVVQLVVDFRASVLHAADHARSQGQDQPQGPRPHLTVLPNDEG